MLNENHDLKNKDFSNFEHSKYLPRHGWYHFKEGFSPLLVEEAIKHSELDGDSLIVDPFSGSGTTPLVASSSKLKCIGFEVNPFMAFVSKAKQSSAGSRSILNYRDQVLKSISTGAVSPLEKFSTFTRHGINKGKWLFNDEVLSSFEGGWKATTELPEGVRNLYKLNLLSTAMENCNAYKDGKCVRYKKGWQEKSFNKESFLDTFDKKLRQFVEDIENSPIENKSKIYLGDSRKRLSKTLNSKFKLCITSPPYLNSFDYTDIYRPELFLGRFVKSSEELSNLRHKTLRSHVQVNWNKPTKTDFGILYSNVINEILLRKEQLWNPKLPLMIQAYFEDMERVLTSLKQNAETDASVWIVVSTSAYAGVEIPVDLILADIGSKVGFSLEEVFVMRHIRNSSQNSIKWMNGEANSKNLRESVIVLKNSK